MSRMDLMRSSQLHSMGEVYSFVFPEVTFETILFKSHEQGINNRVQNLTAILAN